jgi:Arc/MetJ-type ribon-helix-helix transcriptional regulator
MTEERDEPQTPSAGRKPKVAITIDPHVKAYVDHAVEAGEFGSVSAAFNEAMLERMRRQRRIRTLWNTKVAQSDPERVARMMAHVESQHDQ